MIHSMSWLHRAVALTGLACALGLAGCGGGEPATPAAEQAVSRAMAVASGRSVAMSATVTSVTVNPAAVSITGILGYGTNLKPDGAFLTSYTNDRYAMPINDSGVVAINGVIAAYPDPGDGFLLTSDGVTYVPVPGGGGFGTFQLMYGHAIDDSGVVTYQRGGVEEGLYKYQLLSRSPPEYSKISIYSEVCECYDLWLDTNAGGEGVAYRRTSGGSNTPSVVRLNGSVSTPLTFGGSSDPNSIGIQHITSPRILANGAIYIGILNYAAAGQPYQILRFAPGTSDNPTVEYSRPASEAALMAWGVNEDGVLVVAESIAGLSTSMKIVDGGVATLIPGTETSTSATYLGVFLNRAGMVAAVRQLGAGTTEVIYIPRTGAAPVRVLATGDLLNGGVIQNITPTSDMNEAGQFTAFTQIDISPLAYPIRPVVSIVTLLFPSIVSLSPASGSAGSTVTITGRHFTGATGVQFNGVAASYSVDSATQITATVPTGATSGPVTVITAAGSATAATDFTVIPPAPTIGGFTPMSGPAGTAVSITGANFTGATGVSFNGAAASFSVVSDTQIAATVPAGATSGTIAVTTAAGSATSAETFTVTSPLGPVIGTVSPTSGGAGTSVTIRGSNFGGVNSVTFNGVSASFRLKGTSQITTTVPAGASSGPLVVSSPNGTASVEFVVVPAPLISSFSPASGAPGTQVTISGSDFVGVQSVTFGGAKASTFSVVGPTSIIATVPKSAKSGTIAVVAAGGSTVSADAFVVVR